MLENWGYAIRYLRRLSLGKYRHFNDFPVKTSIEFGFSSPASFMTQENQCVAGSNPTIFRHQRDAKPKLNPRYSNVCSKNSSLGKSWGIKFTTHLDYVFQCAWSGKSDCLLFVSIVTISQFCQNWQCPGCAKPWSCCYIVQKETTSLLRVWNSPLSVDSNLLLFSLAPHALSICIPTYFRMVAPHIQVVKALDSLAFR